MNVEIGTEAAQFPEKEYINGIFLAMYRLLLLKFQILTVKKDILLLHVFTVHTVYINGCRYDDTLTIVLYFKMV